MTNPFLEDVFVDHPANLPGVGRIHHEVFSRVLASVELLIGETSSASPASGLGRVFLITAPEAGFGKSHLVARLRDHLGSIATTLVLPFARSRPVAWPVALSSVLRQFGTSDRTRGHSASLIEEVSRFFLSRLVLDALASGSVKEGECPEVATRMRSDFASLFARDSDSTILAWVDKRSHDLARLAHPDFSRNLGMGQAELGFWTRVFIDLNLREEGALDQLRGLSTGEARERLVQLLRLTTDYRPVMIVADGLDGFFASESAGMDIAEIVNGIREKVPHSVTLVCLNEDVWSSVFENHLPSAWRDRLTVETVPLRPISREAASDLVRNRLRHTALAEKAVSRFTLRLSDDQGWAHSETKLSPRSVLRQAADLWTRESSTYLQAKPEEEGYAALVEEPLSPLPDKTEPWNPLGDGRPAPTPPHSPLESPSQRREIELAGIDSIINDIRGSGKTVMSESPDAVPAGSPLLPASNPAPAAATSTMTAPPPPEVRGSLGSIGTTPASGLASTLLRDSPALTRAALEQILAQREHEYLTGPALTLDLERLERFIRTVAQKHVALGQEEERYPSSRTICLRWNVRGQSVLTGFESPRNVYFWNNLLQQSLASNREEKIAAFSHPSETFDPTLFASFGFSPAVIRARVDVIGMDDRELAMIYAADLTLREFESTSEAEKATQLIILHLDPLWRRMIQPV